jgi:hypothetical protein
VINLKSIRERAEAATPGPWEDIHPNADDGDIRVHVARPDNRTVVRDADTVAWKLKAKDAAFIAHARTDIPALCDALQKSEAEVKRLREALERIKSGPALPIQKLEHWTKAKKAAFVAMWSQEQAEKALGKEGV